MGDAYAAVKIQAMVRRKQAMVRVNQNSLHKAGRHHHKSCSSRSGSPTTTPRKSGNGNGAMQVEDGPADEVKLNNAALALDLSQKNGAIIGSDTNPPGRSSRPASNRPSPPGLPPLEVSEEKSQDEKVESKSGENPPVETQAAGAGST